MQTYMVGGAVRDALLSRPVNDRDWVVVGDLRNLTSEPTLDDSLETAFRISLEQSRYVNVLPDLKLRDSLARMQRPPGTEVDRAVASEIALREGAWKFIPARPGQKRLADTNADTGNDADAQLYDLATDLGETKNVAAAHPEIVEKMRDLLAAERAKSGDTPVSPNRSVN